MFDRVIATDASEKQIANAQSHKIVEYRVAPAENSGIGSETIDLVMVAQALHWFDLDRFYGEARRVLKNNGVFAASAYNLLHVEPAIDEVVNRYYYDVVGPFWPPERKLVEQFADLPFPFHRGRCAEVRNDSAMESRSSARLSSNVVFDAAVHRCKRQRSVGANNGRASQRLGERETDAPRPLAVDFAGRDQRQWRIAEGMMSKRARRRALVIFPAFLFVIRCESCVSGSKALE